MGPRARDRRRRRGQASAPQPCANEGVQWQVPREQNEGGVCARHARTWENVLGPALVPPTTINAPACLSRCPRCLHLPLPPPPPPPPQLTPRTARTAIHWPSAVPPAGRTASHVAVCKKKLRKSSTGAEIAAEQHRTASTSPPPPPPPPPPTDTPNGPGSDALAVGCPVGRPDCMARRSVKKTAPEKLDWRKNSVRTAPN